MKEIFTPIVDIRRKVFKEVALLAYENKEPELEKLAAEIVEEQDNKITNKKREKALILERIRLALGLDVSSNETPFDEDKDKENILGEKNVLNLPLVNVVSKACMQCEENTVFVTNNCRGCYAHPCSEVCPVDAVYFENGKSVINKDKCVRCGRCVEACPYNAIVKFDRPCKASCGVNAYTEDEEGNAKIDYEKCVSCGQCIVACPFGVVSDKSEIYQTIKAIQNNNEVIAEIAPAFVGQFGKGASPEKIKEALLKLGFSDVIEVALGADMGAVFEAKHFIEKVKTGEEPFLATSCCPSWAVMAKRDYPDIAPYVSPALTPMVVTARVIKENHPNAKIVFIGPCSAKKLEANRRSVKSDVDYVLTFEEVAGMFEAKGIDVDSFEGEKLDDATAAGRGYGYSGGVTKAIVGAINKLDPELEVMTDRADGLKGCKKILTLAKSGKRNGYLLEGMGCPGGCVGGMGTLISQAKGEKEIKGFENKAENKEAYENKYIKEIDEAGIDDGKM